MTEQEILSRIAEARREYARAWRAKNKDKVKAAQKRYWTKKVMETEQKRKEGN